MPFRPSDDVDDTVYMVAIFFLLRKSRALHSPFNTLTSTIRRFFFSFDFDEKNNSAHNSRISSRFCTSRRNICLGSFDGGCRRRNVFFSSFQSLCKWFGLVLILRVFFSLLYIVLVRVVLLHRDTTSATVCYTVFARCQTDVKLNRVQKFYGMKWKKEKWSNSDTFHRADRRRHLGVCMYVKRACARSWQHCAACNVCRRQMRKVHSKFIFYSHVLEGMDEIESFCETKLRSKHDRIEMEWKQCQMVCYEFNACAFRPDEKSLTTKLSDWHLDDVRMRRHIHHGQPSECEASNEIVLYFDRNELCAEKRIGNLSLV